MKRFKRIIVGVMAVAVAAGTIALPAPELFAQSTGSASLSIAPKKTYLMESGMSVDDKLTIRNIDSGAPLQLSLRVVDFTFTNDGGTPKLFLDSKKEPTTWSARSFLTIPRDVSIPASGSKSLDIKVKVPKGHGAGSYYSAIIYSTTAPDGGNVGLSASGVTLVFVNIPGKVNEDLKIERFGVYDRTKSQYSSWFSFEEPMVMAYTLKNSGNVTEAPVGSITLHDMFGRETVVENLNPAGSLALIGQSRTFNSCLKTKAQEVDFEGTRSEENVCTSAGLWPGIYNAKLDLYYGQNGNPTKELHGSTMFWYFPWWFIVALLIVIAVAAFYIRKLVRYVDYKLNGGVKLKKRK